MEQQAPGLRITLRSDGFYPQALHWQGRTLRVLYVESVQTSGLERRYRVRTPEGPYVLRLHIGPGVWQIHRGPGWLERARAHLAALPRYPLPAVRRRAHTTVKAAPPCLPSTAEGGGHANRLALVRQ
jgi:hypothetical protein